MALLSEVLKLAMGPPRPLSCENKNEWIKNIFRKKEKEKNYFKLRPLKMCSFCATKTWVYDRLGRLVDKSQQGGGGGGGGGGGARADWRLKQIIELDGYVWSHMFTVPASGGEARRGQWHKRRRRRHLKRPQRSPAPAVVTQQHSTPNSKHWLTTSFLQGRCRKTMLGVWLNSYVQFSSFFFIVQELCESRGGRPGLSVLTSLLVSVDVKIYWTVLRHWSQLVPNMSTDIWGH